ncbi:MAG: NADH-quinone oxidoreductase subunit NuoK [Deltaproteobacteria bacterium]|nr:MAG: NADH-quinone oxidoreductase subunit NuoK [Deltaproteobacteria bacterium]
MSAVPIPYFLMLAAALFATGAVGFLLRRNLLVILMSIELMLNSVNLTLVAFNRMHGGDQNGQILAFFVIAIAAAEAAVGLAIVLAFFRLRGSVRSDEANTLRN